MKVKNEEVRYYQKDLKGGLTLLNGIQLPKDYQMKIYL